MWAVKTTYSLDQSGYIRMNEVCLFISCLFGCSSGFKKEIVSSHTLLLSCEMNSSTGCTYLYNWWWCLMEGEYSISYNTVFTVHHLLQYSLCAQIFPDDCQCSWFPPRSLLSILNLPLSLTPFFFFTNTLTETHTHLLPLPVLLLSLWHLDVWHAGFSLLVIPDEYFQQELQITSDSWPRLSDDVFAFTLSYMYGGCDEGCREMWHLFRPNFWLPSVKRLHPFPFTHLPQFPAKRSSKKQADAHGICSTWGAKLSVYSLTKSDSL